MAQNLITVFYLDHSNDFSGGQKSLLALLPLLDRARFNPIVIVDARAQRMIADLNTIGVTHLQINFLNLPLIEYILFFIPAIKIWMLMKMHRCDLLHCNTFKSGFIGAVLSLVSSVPIIFRARLGITILSHGVIDSIIFKRSDLILANSHYVKKTFDQRFGPSQKVKVIYNPLAEKIGLNVEVIAVIRKKYFNDPSLFYFGLIGRIEPIKRLQDVIEAVRILSLKGITQFRVLFIGANPLAGGEKYFQLLQSEIKKNKLERFFNFTGYISEIHEITSLLNCVILCSEGEALSRGVYESQLLGVPVIASESGGNPELVIHEKTGMLFKLGDSTDLAEKMNKLMNNNNLIIEIIKNSSSLVKDRFAPTNTIELELAEYNKLVSGEGGKVYLKFIKRIIRQKEKQLTR